MNSINRWFANLKGGVILTLVVLLVSSAITFYLFNKVITEARQANETRLIQNSLDDIGFHVKSAESAVRAFLLTGDAELVISFATSKQISFNAFDTISGYLEKSDWSDELVDSLRFYMSKRYDLLNELSKNFQAGHLTDAERRKLVRNGEQTMDQLLALEHQISLMEIDQHETGYITTENSIRSVRVMIGVLMVIAIGVIMGAFIVLIKSQHEISDQEMKYRNLFELSREVIFTMNQQYALTDINSAVVEHLGYDQEEIKNIGLLPIISEPDRTHIKHMIESSSLVRNVEVRLVDKQNQIKIFLLSIGLTDAVKGTYQGSLFNIDDRLKLEEEKVSLDRFASVGRVARLIAHEVRNPLTNISLSVEALSNGGVEELNDYLRIISNNAQRINALMTELLSTTKLTEFNFESIGLNQLLEDTLLAATDRIKLKNINLEKNYDPAICSVHADAEKLKVALLNIIVNAIEAMPEQGTLKLSTTKLKDKCLITIADNGKGINKDQIKQIFQPFFSTKQNGTGLGLAMAQNIILYHKGTIRLESEVDHGTTFYITLLIPDSSE